MMLRHPDTVYDLKRGSLKDALAKFFPKLREIKATNPDYLNRCAKCFLKGLCEQCPAKSWMEYGTLDTPVEYLCEVAHTQARYLGLLGKDEMGWEVSRWRERISRFVGLKKEGILMELKVSLKAIYAPSEDAVAREVQGEFILIPITNGIGDLEDEIFTLNQTGRAIWNKLDGKKSLQETADCLALEFEAGNAEIKEDVLGLAGELLKRKMIVETKRG